MIWIQRAAPESGDADGRIVSKLTQASKGLSRKLSHHVEGGKRVHGEFTTELDSIYDARIEKRWLLTFTFKRSAAPAM